MISNLFASKSKAERQCPKCGSLQIARSQRIDLEDRLLSLINIYPYRCQQHICKHRFQATGRV
jgi:predicted RNA-binding Zn-ribbon protein involved in translation (DUF1610 family)